MAGKLYLVGTPIGNLKDITLRALETLKECDIIAAEDTRQTLKLLNHFEIKKAMLSYHKFNENDKSTEIIELLLDGKNVALVTDAGMPGISDPGSVIVKKCIDNDILFEVVPGATAFVTALIYSGLDTTKFMFRGFLPRENKARKEVLEEVENCRDTLIFYEAPHRLKNTLSTLYECLGNRNVALCRELTKLHETIFRNTLEQAIKFYEENEPRGEFVIVVSGKSDELIEQEKRSKWDNISIEEHIKMHISNGMSKKEAIKQTAKDRNLQKSEVYKCSINIK